MRRIFLSFALIASGGLAHADECDEKIRQIVLGTGAQFMEQYGKGGVQLRHPLFDEFGLGCERLSVSVSINNAFPSADHLKMLAKVGQITTGAKAASIRAALEKCHRTALAEDTVADLQISGAEVSCLVARDGKQGDTTFHIYPR